MRTLLFKACGSAAALLAALAYAAPALASERGDAGEGRRYAEAVCAECHATGAGASSSRIRNARPFQEIANTPGMTHTALAVWMQTMHPSMPNLMLEPDDLNNVIAYIVSLKK